MSTNRAAAAEGAAPDAALLEAATSDAAPSDDAAAPGVASPELATVPTASEIIAQTGANAVTWDPPLTQRYMSPEGIEDPFPDQIRRARPRDAAILLGLGAGFAVASAITARLTLLPDCEDQSDLTTCAIPNEAEIGLRSGRLVGTIGFTVGAAAFGAFGGRELGQLIDQGTRRPLEQRRRIAVGIGSSAVVAGLTGIAVGSSVMALGTRRSLRLASTFDSTTDVTDPEQVARINETLDHVKTARIGLMVLAASPVFLATGISLLVHRPKLERRVRITPTASLTDVGISATVRF
ncbi:MAG: hypothetical protein AAGF11_26370 [Myxococcota bacterium]